MGCKSRNGRMGAVVTRATRNYIQEQSGKKQGKSEKFVKQKHRKRRRVDLDNVDLIRRSKEAFSKACEFGRHPRDKQHEDTLREMAVDISILIGSAGIPSFVDIRVAASDKYPYILKM